MGREIDDAVFLERRGPHGTFPWRRRPSRIEPGVAPSAAPTVSTSRLVSGSGASARRSSGRDRRAVLAGPGQRRHRVGRLRRSAESRIADTEERARRGGVARGLCAQQHEGARRRHLADRHAPHDPGRVLVGCARARRFRHQQRERQARQIARRCHDQVIDAGQIGFEAGPSNWAVQREGRPSG